jgi:peptide/nickel transport system substrate-binding protein
MVERVSAPDDETVVFRLKYPFGAFLPARVAPSGQCYSTCCYRA